MKHTSVQLSVAGKTLTLTTGQLALLATSAVVARLGDTQVLATVVEGKVREDIDYFPLTVEYIERLYAGGRIKGSRWVKREGRPSDEAILAARLIDRSIRPLFPKDYRNEVQVVITVLSVDGENEPDTLSMIAVSSALSISRIPWKGPISAVRMGYLAGKEPEHGAEFLVNPGIKEREFSGLDLVVSQTKEKTLMLEAGALQVSEESIVEAIERAREVNTSIIATIEQLVKEVGDPKGSVTPDALLNECIALIEKAYRDDVRTLIEARLTKEAVGSEFEALVDKIFEHEKMQDGESELDKKTVAKATEIVFYKCIRDEVVEKGVRPDGRKQAEIRPIGVLVSVLPRTHGSAVFQRGNTQALTVVTLGSPRLEQLIESAEGEETKRYMHHYSMPAYSVGETGRMGTPTRREIGHGALAERALLAVIPKQEKFPYTIRVVSEILTSNGSTSMASACGSSLALMDAGVPIDAPVAGVAMGMMAKGEKYVLLSDILGLEDFAGDMDFKVAGTKNGVTAIQLDVKNDGLTIAQVTEALSQAREGRLFILQKMDEVLPQSRTALSEFAPKVEMIKVPVEKIGEVIGPGGRIIRNIIAETGATVDVDDDGTVTITGTTEESVEKASVWVKGLVRELEPGEVFEEAMVKRILPFGAFVEVSPGKEGMVHVSQMATGFVKDPHDVVKVGDMVKVRVVEVDEQGRVNLSMLFGEEANAVPRPSSAPRVRPAPYGVRRESQPLGRGPNTRGSEPVMQSRSEHPLAKQFRRERRQEFQKSPRFRKSHY